MVRPYRTFSTNSFPGETSVQGAFALVWSGSSISNLLEPQPRRSSKLCSVLSRAVGVVRLCRTFSNLLFTGEARCAGCFCTSFGVVHVHRPFSTHSIAALTRCVEVFHRSSEVEKVPFSRTTLNSCEQTLHTWFSLRCCGSRRFEEVRST